MSIANTSIEASVERLVREALSRSPPRIEWQRKSGTAAQRWSSHLRPHCHVTQAGLERLFGKGHRRTVPQAALSGWFFPR